MCILVLEYHGTGFNCVEKSLYFQNFRGNCVFLVIALVRTHNYICTCNA